MSPVAEEELRRSEQAGSFALPGALRLFLRTFGLAGIEGLELYPPAEIRWLSEVA